MMATTPPIDRESQFMAGLTLALLAALLAPLTLVQIPAMLDYVNHLARMSLLMGAAPSAYDVRWTPCPDLAMDLIVPVLARVMPVTIAAKVFLGASLTLVVSGAMALEWTVKGRLRLAGLCALLVLFSLPLAWGQLNFTFGLGLAVWAVALWVRVRDRPAGTRWAIHAVIVAALFVSHLFDLGIYGLTIGLWEVSRLRGRPNPGQLARLALFMASPVLIGVAAMALAGGGLGQLSLSWDFGLKGRWLLLFMNVYDPGLSIVTGAIVLGLIGLAVGARWLEPNRAGLWIGAGLLALYIALPVDLFGSQYLDVRLITTAALMLPPFVESTFPPGLPRAAILGVTIAIIATNNMSVARAWWEFQVDYRQFQASFALLKPGSAVVVAVRDEADRSDNHPLFYAPTLAAPAAGVFVTSFYSSHGLQPVAPRPEYASRAVTDPHDYTPPRLSTILPLADATLASDPPPYLIRWAWRFQYLYLLGPPGSTPLPGRLSPIASGRRFVLYRIGQP